MPEWEKEKWLNDAHNLLQWFEGVASDIPVTLLLRHSHRLTSKDQSELLQMRLTSLGHRMAIKFGSRLTGTRHLEVFHSEHPRCQETAQRIVEGYETKVRSAILRGSIRELLGPYVHTSIGSELMELGVGGFINQWGKGEYPPSQIEKIDIYAKRLWNETVGRTDKLKNPNAVHIHVTHDLVLMSLRRVILGIETSDDNWTPFLGGFGILKYNGSTYWFERGKTTEVNIP